MLCYIKVTNAGADYMSLPKHWINDHIVVTSTSHYKDMKWRKQILNELCVVNDACWEAFKSMGNDLEELTQDEIRRDSWNRSVRAKLRKSGERRFVAGMLYHGGDQMIFQPNTGSTTVMDFVELTSAIREFDYATSTFTIWARFLGELLEVGFAQESDRDEWHELLQQVRRDYFYRGH
ncbi:unnamed protein product [Strongylus vulgaris]|uniref:Uncharacterized protein n=1 Tax=Strongylus vulgaris TaxID=40348 RepID=A0A3P7K840_STRVU|nr:unnamed protein product [Strongylus vulgaris]